MTQQVDFLLSPKAIRERCNRLFNLTKSGQGELEFHPEKWDEVVDFVYQTILEKYPTLDIPFHSRLGHFRPGGVDRIQWPELALNQKNPTEKVRTLIDLIIPSVLLDAGAGDLWKFSETKTGQTLNRSEGLGVASFHMFLSGQFSAGQGAQTTAQTTSEGLLKLTKAQLESAFQVSEKNPLIGVEGRLGLLQKLGETMQSNPNVFKNGRPSDLLETFYVDQNIDALQVLKSILTYLGPIWPSRLKWENTPLGDTWSHPKLGAPNSFEALIPFHKLSQWLSYSLLDACQLGGLPLKNVDQLTGLPEYRNGGLFVDLGMLTFKDPANLTKGISAEMPVTIEWRAATVILLDEVAQRIQKKLGKNSNDFPLAKVLEGGTWWAGRRIAALKRPGSPPPIKIILDGTVF